MIESKPVASDIFSTHVDVTFCTYIRLDQKENFEKELVALIAKFQYGNVNHPMAHKE